MVLLEPLCLLLDLSLGHRARRNSSAEEGERLESQGEAKGNVGWSGVSSWYLTLTRRRTVSEIKFFSVEKGEKGSSRKINFYSRNWIEIFFLEGQSFPLETLSCCLTDGSVDKTVGSGFDVESTVVRSFSSQHLLLRSDVGSSHWTSLYPMTDRARRVTVESSFDRGVRGRHRILLVVLKSGEAGSLGGFSVSCSFHLCLFSGQIFFLCFYFR